MGTERMSSLNQGAQLAGMVLRGSLLALLLAAMLALVPGVPVGRAEAKGPANGQLIPSDVATDPAGNVYVADQGSARIQKFSANGAFIRSWGGKGSGRGQFLFNLEGIAVDAAGNVYVTEVSGPNGQGADRIQKFTSSGAFIAKWGTRGSGNGQFCLTQGISPPTPPATSTSPTPATTASRSSPPTAPSSPSGGAEAPATGSSIIPSASPPTPPATSTSPIPSLLRPLAATTASRSSPPTAPSSPSGGARDPATGSSRFQRCGHRRRRQRLRRGRRQPPHPEVHLRRRLYHRMGEQGLRQRPIQLSRGIGTDASGNVYVADTGNNRVQKFTRRRPLYHQVGTRIPIALWSQAQALAIPTTGRKAFFKPSCGLDRRCRARVVIKSVATTLARGRYSAPAHSSHKVAIALTAAGRGALTRKRRIRAKLTIIDTRTHKRETLPVTLRR